MKRPPGRMTGPEHEAWLKATGQYEAMMEKKKAKEAEHAARVEEQRVALIPLVEALQNVDPTIASIRDLTREPFPEKAPRPNALPVLLEHLQKPYRPNEREIMARALAVPEAVVAWPLLKKLYLEEPDNQAKRGLADAVAVAAGSRYLDELIELAKDATNGSTRLFFADTLLRSKDPKARAAVESLQDDSQLKKHIKLTLRIERLKKRAKDKASGS
jgi:hypothetical protein